MSCHRKRRRLAELPQHIDDMIQWLSQQAAELTLDHCEGDHELFLEVGNFLRVGACEVGEAFGWANDPPYIFANADDSEVARCYLDKLDGMNLAQQHPVVQFHIEKFGSQLRALAAGDRSTLDNSFFAERDIFRRMPLTSDPAEGYHRSISCTKAHARAAGSTFLLASNRLEQNLRNARQWCQSDDGLEQFRYNFKCFSRILQTRKKTRYRPVRQPMKARRSGVFRKVSAFVDG